MHYPITIIERAYQLARSGECANHAEVASRLKLERFDNVEAHLGFPGIRKTLQSLCKLAVADSVAGS
jgi:hypothetical protein